MKRNYKETVFYEIYPNSFKDSNGDGYGDLQGIISKLDYIASLGFSGIWLNPIYDSPFFDGGYDIRDFFKVSERFGTEEDLKQLIEECHKRDIRLFLDLVPGHASLQQMNSGNELKIKNFWNQLNLKEMNTQICLFGTITYGQMSQDIV